jgi:2-dehydro-3-deoxyglucarate aldolase/4-hydroxy-2-oxoheptanedioate aldolase
VSTSSFSRRLREASRPLIGTWLKLPSLEVVDILCDAGFDFLVIDQEHAPLDFAQAFAAITLAQARGVTALVRVPDRSGSHYQRLLDAGADGILVPHVRSGADAAEAVAAMTFPPEGTRGMGLTSRAGSWGRASRNDYVARGGEVFRAAQLEDVEALDDAEAILATPGLSGAFIGMGDLQLSTGLTADAPELSSRVARVLELAEAVGIPVGTAVQSPAQFRASAEQGYAYIMVGNDVGMLATAAARLVDESLDAQ